MFKDILNEAVLNTGIEFPDLGKERLTNKYALGIVPSKGMKALEDVVGIGSARKLKKLKGKSIFDKQMKKVRRYL